MKEGALRARFAVLLLVSIVIALCILQATAGAVTVNVDPAAQSVTAGDTLYVQMVVEDVPNMGAYQVILHFVPEALSVIQVNEGEFMKGAGATLGSGMEQIDNTIGRVAVYYSLTARGASVTGSGVLATVTLQAAPTASGTFELLLNDVLLVDGTGTRIPVETISNGTCTITRAEQPAPTASPAPATGSGGGGTGNMPTSTPASTTGEPQPAATPGEVSPSPVSGTAPSTGPGSGNATSTGPASTPESSAEPPSTPESSACPETAPATGAKPTTKIPGFTAAGVSACLLVVLTYMLRQQRKYV